MVNTTVVRECDLRVAGYEIPGSIDIRRRGHRHVFAGSVGQILHETWEAICSNYKVVAATSGEQIGADMGNGSYSGIIGLVQRNEAEMTFTPYGMKAPPDVVDYSTVTNAIKGKLFQFPELNVSENNLLNNLEVCTPGVLLCILAMNIVVAMTYKLLTHRRKASTAVTLVDCQYETSRCMVNQANVNLLRSTCSQLSILLLGATFMLMEVFEQAISGEKVSKDYTTIVDSIEDFKRLASYEPFLQKDAPFTEIIAQNPAQKFVWERALKRGLDKTTYALDANKMPSTMESWRIFLGNEYLGGCLTQVICYRNKKRKLWVAQSSYAEIPQIYYLSKAFDPARKRVLEE